MKAGSRRWLVYTFYNILNFASINSWIIFKCTTGKKISRHNIIQSLADEMQKEYIKKSIERKRKNEENQATKILSKCKKCEIKKKKNTIEM